VSAGSRLAGLCVAACAFLSLLVASGVAAAQSGPLTFGACASGQVAARKSGLQCAALDVPFDRANPGAGSVALAVQRVPASAPHVGTIVLLAGGPGQPALPAFEEFLAPLAREAALQGFELVAFDQRGTGQSQGLVCPRGGSLRGGLSSYIGTCGSALGATRSFYTSQESVEDLDALRQALGGTPLSLFAVSYGTRVAGMYAREHPQGVARMVLDSSVPTTGPLPLGSERIRALRRMLDEGACAGGACRSFSSDVYGDLTRLVAVLHRHPLRTKIYDARGRLRPARLSERGVLDLLVGLDVAPTVRELVPAAIVAAARGDARPLARLTSFLEPGRGGSGLAATIAAGGSLAPIFAPGALGEGSSAIEAPRRDSAISIALYAATSCIENELPWRPDSAPSGRAATLRSWLASLPAGTTAPFAPAAALPTSGLDVCLDWPATPPAPPAPTGLAATPTLILSGYDDLRTPYEQAVTIAGGYTDAQLLRIPDVGHSTVSQDQTGCARRAMIDFLASGQAPASCPGSGEAQALPLPPASLAKVAPAAARSRLAGRVAGAAAMTLEDLFGQTGFDGGGLRGGGWTIQRRGFALRRMIDVPGVALSGHVDVHARPGSRSLVISARLRVGGRLRGELTLRGRTLSGRLGGALVRAHLGAL
jgi:pimeloyl-ACP methyl ester carboxylesterase